MTYPLRLQTPSPPRQRGRGWGPLRSNGRVRWCVNKRDVSAANEKSPEQPDTSLTVSPDTSLTVFGIGLGLRARFGAGRPPRTKARKLARTAINEAQGNVGEEDEPVAVGPLADANTLPFDDLGHEQHRPPPLDIGTRT